MTLKCSNHKSAWLAPLLFLLVSAIPAAAGPIFSILGANPVTGNPGDSVGWGFQISNDTSSYLVVSSAEVGPALLGAGFFQEFMASNFVVVNPNSTFTQSYDASLQQGIGMLTVFNTTAPGLYSAYVTITFDLYTNDPNDPFFFSSSTDVLGNILQSSQMAQLRVPGANTPEPSAFALLLIGGSVLNWRKVRWPSRRSSAQVQPAAGSAGPPHKTLGMKGLTERGNEVQYNQKGQSRFRPSPPKAVDATATVPLLHGKATFSETTDHDSVNFPPHRDKMGPPPIIPCPPTAPASSASSTNQIPSSTSPPPGRTSPQPP